MLQYFNWFPTVEEIRLAFNELSRSGAEDVILLHCVLNYPTEDCGILK